MSNYSYKKSKLSNMNLHRFINNLFKTIYDIIDQLLKMTTYKNETNIVERITKIIQNMIKILTQKDRIFYIGIMILLISFGLYLIEITSN